MYNGEESYMTLEREFEHQHPQSSSTPHPTHDTAGSSPAAPQDAPFFATKDDFLQAVYANWEYFIRYLLKRYLWLFEQERETGARAPVGAGWYVPIVAPKANRNFEAALGSCDVQDMLVDAIERCLNPLNASYYTRYTPLCRGRRVQFTTWFLSQVRSCAWSRFRTKQRRQRRAQPRPHHTSVPVQEEHTTTIALDTFITQKLATPEDVEMPSEEKPDTAQSGEPSHDPYDALDAKLDLDTLLVNLTESEKAMVRTRREP
jgi:hypothetical protein